MLAALLASVAMFASLDAVLPPPPPPPSGLSAPPELVADLAARAAAAGLIASAAVWSAPSAPEWPKAWAAICQGKARAAICQGKAWAAICQDWGGGRHDKRSLCVGEGRTACAPPPSLPPFIPMCPPPLPTFMHKIWASQWTEQSWLSRQPPPTITLTVWASKWTERAWLFRQPPPHNLPVTVWASKWTERAWLSRRARGVNDDELYMAVLLQQVMGWGGGGGAGRGARRVRRQQEGYERREESGRGGDSQGGAAAEERAGVEVWGGSLYCSRTTVLQKPAQPEPSTPSPLAAGRTCAVRVCTAHYQPGVPQCRRERRRDGLGHGRNPSWEPPRQVIREGREGWGGELTESGGAWNDVHGCH